MQSLYICITPFFPAPDNWRGSYVFDQVIALRESGLIDQVIVLMPTSFWQPQRDYQYNGIHVHYFRTLSFPSYILNGFFNIINTRFFLKKVKMLQLDYSSIKIAHAHTASFGVYALALKQKNIAIKTVVQHHALDPLQIRNGRLASCFWNARFRAHITSKIVNEVDINLCISTSVEESLRNFPFPGKYIYYTSYRDALIPLIGCKPVSPKRCLILPNGVDVNIFHKILDNNRDTTVFRIGCIGNFTDLKDQISLIQAVEIISRSPARFPLELSLVGTGPLRNYCEEYVKKQNLSSFVHFHPEVFHGELTCYYNSLDLFILPSWFEAFGCVYLEAAACGVPFMACEGQGIQDYLTPEDRHYWLFPPKRPDIIADKIIDYHKNRPKQRLTKPINIRNLIVAYLNEIFNN